MLNHYMWAVVVAQLVEQLLLTPEIHSLNPGIGKFYYLLKRETMKQKTHRKGGREWG